MRSTDQGQRGGLVTGVKQTLGVFVAVLLALALIGLGMETAGRMLARQTEQSMLVSPHLNWSEWHRYDPDLMWALKPNLDGVAQQYPFTKRMEPWRVSTNDLGLRHPLVAPKGDRYRILCLGDSRTYGFGVENDETWPARLQATLDVRAPGRYDVINAGVPGYSIFHGARYLETLGITLEPDMVLLCFGYNDASPVPPPGFGDWDWENPQRRAGWRYLLKRVFQGLDLETERPDGVRETRLTPGEFADSLLRIARFCAARDIAAVPVAWPSLPELLGEHLDRPHLSGMIVAAGDLAGMPVISLRDALAAHVREIFLDDVHLDAAGYRLVAESIADALPQVFRQLSDAYRRPEGMPPRLETETVEARMDRYRLWMEADPSCYKPYAELDALLLAQNDPEGRVAEWRRAAAAYPDEGRPRFLLGLALEARGDHDAALDAYRAAVECEPGDPAIRASLGFALRRKGEHRAAAAAFEAALRINPGARHLWADLIAALCDAGDFSAARQKIIQAQREGATIPRELRDRIVRESQP